MGESSEGSVGAMKMMEEGPNQHKIAHKRINKFQEIMEKGEVDGISLLPDCLILEILSRLPSTKDAIRTGTLSNRWANLWTRVPTLIFTHIGLGNPNSVSDFVLSVDKTLSQCRQLKLKKFEVYTTYDIRFEPRFKNWIHHAISCNVEELNLDFIEYTGREAEVRLDQSIFFVSSCLTDLRLRGFTLNPSGPISWKNLRSLCISYVNLDENLIINILSGSPLLETLVLEYWYGGTHFVPYDEPETNAPISLTQCPQLKKLKKFEVHSIYEIRVESTVNSWIRYAIRCNIKELNLSFWSAMGVDVHFKLDQILFTSSCFTEIRLDGCMINPVGAISWKNLRSLCISYGSLDEDLIKIILSGSPVLETLELEKCFHYRRLDITSKSVKNLVLSGYVNAHDASTAGDIEINAPNILSLTIQNGMIERKLLLENVSSLVKANLNYTCTSSYRRQFQTTPTEAEQEMLKEVILKLGHVKEVKIGILCYKVLCCLQAKGFIVPSNVKFPQVT